MTSIVVSRRTNDYKAEFENDPAHWGCGDSIKEAIGDLVISHQKELEITFVDKTMEPNA